VTSFAELTTLGVGGPLADLVTACTDEEIVDALTDDAFVLGGGSNLVVADDAFSRRVVRIATRGIEVQPDGDRVIVEAAAGEPWDEFVAFTVEQGFSGLESLSGIPGLVGATGIQNVGAYGQEVSSVIGHVTVLDRLSGRIESMSGAACGFGYRTSRFKATPDRWVVLAASFVLQPGGLGQARYAELARVLGTEIGGVAPIEAIREAVLRLRRAKGMVLDPEDPDTRSVGSFFLNPVVEPGTAALQAHPGHCQCLERHRSGGRGPGQRGAPPGARGLPDRSGAGAADAQLLPAVPGRVQPVINRPG